MGGGTWSSHVYNTNTRASVNSGTNFGYTRTTSGLGRDQWKAHKDNDPLGVAGPGSPFAGMNVRESRDNPEHPESTPIAIFFDETGSMGEVPRQLQKDLSKLFNKLIDQGLVSDPQIMMGAYGDAEVDMVPLQASQFESDNRIDDALDKLFLEGNGGGNGHEHSALAWYYVANHTATDAWDKRGKRGYLFTIGDEITGTIPRQAIKKYTGDTVEIDISPKKALADANERWNVFHIVIDNWTAERQQSVRFYTNLLGGNCIVLENLDEIADTIAMVVGYFEGRLDKNVNVSQATIDRVYALAQGKRPALTSV